MGEDALTRINHAGWKGKGDDSIREARSTLDLIFYEECFLSFFAASTVEGTLIGADS